MTDLVGAVKKIFSEQGFCPFQVTYEDCCQNNMNCKSCVESKKVVDTSLTLPKVLGVCQTFQQDFTALQEEFRELEEQLTKTVRASIKLSKENNNVVGKAGCISAADSQVPVYAIPTNEELEIARETSELLM